MPVYGIEGQKRVASFLAQVAHETAQFSFVEELASGASYDTGRLAARLGNTPEDDGDGQRYKGRGLIQVTGHDNYLACSKGIFGDDRLLHFPELLKDPKYAVQSACWWWQHNGCNELADKGDQTAVSKRVNGGTNGLHERLAFFDVAQKVIA
jgi:putative chitinase